MKLSPVVKIILIINCVFFGIEYLASVTSGSRVGYEWFSLINALYPIGSASLLPHQYLSYMFIHGSFMHLFFNMWQLLIFGSAVEQIYGSKRFALYYLLCGIGSALANQMCALLGIISSSLVVGASGAIYGVMAAAAFNFPNARMFIIPFPFPIKLKWLVVAFTVYDFYSGVFSSDGVAHFAHLGGLIVGLIILFVWKKMDSRPSRRYGNYHSSSYAHTGGYDKGSESMTDKIRKAFSSKPKMTVVQGSGDRQQDYEYNERRRQHNEEIDRILDKVRKGGFESLTEEEKRTLFDASRR